MSAQRLVVSNRSAVLSAASLYQAHTLAVRVTHPSATSSVMSTIAFCCCMDSPLYRLAFSSTLQRQQVSQVMTTSLISKRFLLR